MKQHNLPLLFILLTLLIACGEQTEKGLVDLEHLTGVYAMTESTTIIPESSDTIRQVWDVYDTAPYMMYEITESTIHRYWANANEKIDFNEYQLETLDGITYICLNGAHAESFGITSSVIKITLLNKTHFEYEIDALSVDGPQKHVKLLRKE